MTYAARAAIPGLPWRARPEETAMPDSYETLELRREGPVLWCTLNRPDALNALSRRLVDDLRSFYTALASDRETRVVVLRGAGRAFCAGLDLKEGPADGAGSVSGGLRGQRHISELALMMRRLPQVFLACVHGPACGGGFMLALASDLRIAGASARMNAAFIKLGLSGCDVGVSYLLPRLVGASVAAELILTGRFIHAERARELGLVSTVVPDDELEAEARKLVDELLATSPLGLRLSKECLNASLDTNSMEAVVAMEDRNQILCAQTHDFREGVGAFLGKRRPVWKDA
jgi:enoyl-CoA hydratase/carnithine racemase